jgi:hypothetical protein
MYRRFNVMSNLMLRVRGLRGRALVVRLTGPLCLSRSCMSRNQCGAGCKQPAHISSAVDLEVKR